MVITKPGYKTTEFWFSVIAAGLSAVYASGLVLTPTVEGVVGTVAAVLGGLGYTVSRGKLKQTEL